MKFEGREKINPLPFFVFLIMEGADPTLVMR